jgi:hypothetical protein
VHRIRTTQPHPYGSHAQSGNGSYQLPTITLDGTPLMHFGGFVEAR